MTVAEVMAHIEWAYLIAPMVFIVVSSLMFCIFAFQMKDRYAWVAGGFGGIIVINAIFYVNVAVGYLRDIENYEPDGGSFVWLLIVSLAAYISATVLLVLEESQFFHKRRNKEFLQNNHEKIDAFPGYVASDDEYIQEFRRHLDVDKSLVSPITEAVKASLSEFKPIDKADLIEKLRDTDKDYLDRVLARERIKLEKARDSSSIASDIERVFDRAGPSVKHDENGKALKSYLDPDYNPLLPTELTERLFNIPVRVQLPEKMRVEHHSIVANTGRGKTQLLQNLILDDLESNAGIVVIDSAGDMAHNLIQVVPLNRLVFIDPTDVEYPFALNLFDVGRERIDAMEPAERERVMNGVIEMYDFVFSSLLDAEMTSQQSTAFKFVTRLMMQIPDATIHTLREVFEKNGIDKYWQYVEELSPTAQSFFEHEFKGSSQFQKTREGILRRIYGILENQTFERMFSHPRSKFSIKEAMDQGKVVVIYTSQSHLKDEASAIMGRFFVAQIMQAVSERTHASQRHRTYLYIDEAKPYIDQSIETILNTARKYELGLILAMQSLSQITDPQLRQAVASVPSIKMANGVAPDDMTTLLKHMGDRAEIPLRQSRKGDFVTWVRDDGLYQWNVEFGRLEDQPRRNTPQEVREEMRRLYGEPVQDHRPTPPKENGGDPNDVPESGDY